jgi:hypothetical protein
MGVRDLLFVLSVLCACPPWRASAVYALSFGFSVSSRHFSVRSVFRFWGPPPRLAEFLSVLCASAVRCIHGFPGRISYRHVIFAVFPSIAATEQYFVWLNSIAWLTAFSSSVPPSR